MAALTAGRKTQQMGTTCDFDYSQEPLAAGAKVFKGGIVARNTSGYAVAGAATSTLVVLGIAEEDADNTSGSNGDVTARVRRGIFRVLNGSAADEIVQADAYGDCFLADDQSVRKTSSGGARPRAGRIIKVEPGTSGDVWVWLGPDNTPAAIAAIQTGTATLVAGTKTVNTGVKITSSSKVFVSLNTPAGGTQGVKYKVPDASLVTGEAGTGAFAITAVDAAGATVATDTSTINYMVVN